MSRINEPNQKVGKIFYTFNEEIFYSLSNSFERVFKRIATQYSPTNYKIITFQNSVQKIAFILFTPGKSSFKIIQILLQDQNSFMPIENLRIFFLDFVMCEKTQKIRDILYPSRCEETTGFDFILSNNCNIVNLSNFSIRSFENNRILKTRIKPCHAVVVPSWIEQQAMKGHVTNDFVYATWTTVNPLLNKNEDHSSVIHSHSTSCILAELNFTDEPLFHTVMLDRLGFVCFYLCGIISL